MFECACHHNEHLFTITFDSEDKLAYVEIQLNHYLPWWRRCLIGLKYMRGFKSKYGYWSETVLDTPSTKKLEKLLKTFNKECK